MAVFLSEFDEKKRIQTILNLDFNFNSQNIIFNHIFQTLKKVIMIPMLISKQKKYVV